MKILQRKWLKRLGIGLLVLLLALMIGFFLINESLPQGESGRAADSLARAMMQAIGHDNWEETGAIRWDFDGRRQHLWDRERHLAQVSWDENVVLVDLDDLSGQVMEKKFNSTKADSVLIREAWEIWVNDSFWLNPISKIFDPGTVRKRVKWKGKDEALLITYQSGGVTPGDSYLWIVGPDGLPKAWKLWVSIVPIGGLRFSWEAWITTVTGVKIATHHRSTLFDLRLRNVEAAQSLETLTGAEDPFKALGKDKPKQPKRPTTTASF